MRIRINKNKVIVKDGDLEFSIKEDISGDKVVTSFELTGEDTLGILSCPATLDSALSEMIERAEKMTQRIIDSFI